MTPEPASPDDVPALRALHIANWREAYAGLLPPAALGTPAEAYMDTKWAPENLGHRQVWVCREDVAPVGFIALEREASGAVFVDNLHVAPGARGRGLSRRLMRIAAEAAGRASVWLVVLNTNTRARAIYRAWGGREHTPFDAPFLGITVRDRRVDWASGHALGKGLGAA